MNIINRGALLALLSLAIMAYSGYLTPLQAHPIQPHSPTPPSPERLALERLEMSVIKWSDAVASLPSTIK